MLTVLRCISCPDLVILAYRGDKLSCGQAQNEVKFDFHVKFDLEVQDRSPPKTIGILTKVFCTYVSNLVILVWTADELSCRQASDWYTHTDRYTDRGDDNTRRPKLASGNYTIKITTISPREWYMMALSGDIRRVIGDLANPFTNSQKTGIEQQWFSLICCQHSKQVLHFLSSSRQLRRQSTCLGFRYVICDCWQLPVTSAVQNRQSTFEQQWFF